MAPERVYLHVGAPKTGTTYLQGRLATNRAALKRDGILYPRTVIDAHHLAVWDLRGTPPQRQQVRGIDGAWEKLVRRTNSWDGEAVLVSSELFVHCDGQQIRRAREAFAGDVHIVYTARDLVRQVPAVWQERVKNQHTDSYPDYLTAVVRAGNGGRNHAFWRAQDAAAVLQRWSSGLPPGSVHVVTAPPDGSASSVLWDRFLRAIGRRGHDYPAEASGPTNRSLGMLQTELLRRYNGRHGGALPWPVYRRTIRGELDTSFAEAIPDPRKVTLDSSDYAFFASEARETVSRLGMAGYDVVGDLDDLLPPPLPAEAAPVRAGATDATDGELLDAALAVLHAVLSRDQGSRAKPDPAEADGADGG